MIWSLAKLKQVKCNDDPGDRISSILFNFHETSEGHFNFLSIFDR